MFDTMTMTKIVGGLCGTFLIFLLGGFVAEFIYHPAHGDDHHQAYTIAVDDGGAEEEVVEVDFGEVYADDDEICCIEDDLVDCPGNSEGKLCLNGEPREFY